MKTWKILGAGALALAITACGRQQEDFTAATPDAAGLSLELAGGQVEGFGAAPGEAGLTTALVAPPVPAQADELGDARESIRWLNGEVRRVLDRVADVAKLPGTSELGDLKVYGPAVRCVQEDAGGACQAQASLRLAIRHHYLRVYSWALEARPVASTDPADFKPVLAGWLARNGEAHRGRGRAAFNLENLRAAAPGYTGRGYLLVGFGHGAAGGKSVRYKLVDFTPDPAQREAVTAGFVGHVTPLGVHRIRVATFKDVIPGSNPFPREVVLAHLGWVPGLGGRGYLAVADWTDALGNLHGDVPAGQYYLGRGCWSAGGQVRVKEWRFCPQALGPAACLATAPVSVEPAGAQWSDCTGFTGEEPLPGPSAPGAEEDTSDEPSPPADQAPTPEAPPATPGDTAPPPGS
jgi:hypothetical protein